MAAVTVMYYGVAPITRKLYYPLMGLGLALTTCALVELPAWRELLPGYAFFYGAVWVIAAAQVVELLVMSFLFWRAARRRKMDEVRE